VVSRRAGPTASLPAIASATCSHRRTWTRIYNAARRGARYKMRSNGTVAAPESEEERARLEGRTDRRTQLLLASCRIQRRSIDRHGQARPPPAPVLHAAAAAAAAAALRADDGRPVVLLGGDGRRRRRRR
jgi:hypothetical protein